MADFTGTNGNDTFQNLGGGGSLTLVLAGTSADAGVWPSINIVVNGVVVQSNISITANNVTGATQVVSVAVPAGATNFAIQYTNDTQTDWNSGDRNLYIKSVSLNGVAFDPATATYDRTQNGAYFDTVKGQADMVWGGTLTFSGTAVQSASAAGSVGTNDTFNGLAGLDTVVYSGARADYGIAAGASGSFTVSHGSEVDTLVNVERVQFGDMKHALDMSGNAGTVAKLLATLWGETYLSSKDYVGIGLHFADQGMTATDLAAYAAGTTEFAARAGSSSNADFVHTVAQNLGYTGDTSGYLQQLNSGQLTKGALAVMAADYMEATMSATSHVQLMGVMHGGIDFV
jgi:hypothetical protein